MPKPTAPTSAEAARPKHTPGPWHFVNGNLRRVIAATHPAVMNSVSVCGVHRIGRFLGKESDAEQIANGHLIAAAPDLFEALTALLAMQDQMWRRPGGGVLPADYGIARGNALAALAKATAP